MEQPSLGFKHKIIIYPELLDLQTLSANLAEKFWKDWYLLLPSKYKDFDNGLALLMKLSTTREEYEFPESPTFNFERSHQ